MPKKSHKSKGQDYKPEFVLYCPRCKGPATLAGPPRKVGNKDYKIRKVVLLPSKNDLYLTPTAVFDRYPRPIMEYTCVGQTSKVYSKGSAVVSKLAPHIIRRMGRTGKTRKQMRIEAEKISSANREAEEEERIAWMERHKDHVQLSRSGYPIVKYN